MLPVYISNIVSICLSRLGGRREKRWREDQDFARTVCSWADTVLGAFEGRAPSAALLLRCDSGKPGHTWTKEGLWEGLLWFFL